MLTGQCILCPHTIYHTPYTEIQLSLLPLFKKKKKNNGHFTFHLETQCRAGFSGFNWGFLFLPIHLPGSSTTSRPKWKRQSNGIKKTGGSPDSLPPYPQVQLPWPSSLDPRSPPTAHPSTPGMNVVLLSFCQLDTN